MTSKCHACQKPSDGDFCSYECALKVVIDALLACGKYEPSECETLARKLLGPPE